VDRHQAYAAVAEWLDRFRSRPFESLEREVGSTVNDRVRVASGEEFLLEARVEWADARRDRLRISVTADGPGCFHLERLEERIVVKRPSGD
jgi:hypothetical protein